MKTTSKLLLAFTASALLSSSLFASEYERDDEYREYKERKSCKEHREYEYEYKDHKKRSHHLKHDQSRIILKAVYSLDITQEQKNTIAQIQKEYKKERSGIYKAFTSEGFDKDSYIQAVTHKKENFIKAQADMIEKIYKTLTPNQKKELKNKLNDLFEKPYKKRDGSCKK